MTDKIFNKNTCLIGCVDHPMCANSRFGHTLSIYSIMYNIITPKFFDFRDIPGTYYCVPAKSVPSIIQLAKMAETKIFFTIKIEKDNSYFLPANDLQTAMDITQEHNMMFGTHYSAPYIDIVVSDIDEITSLSQHLHDYGLTIHVC